MSIGNRLREERRRMGRSQELLAKECSVSLRALKAYELDERHPPATFLLRLYELCAINPTWLLTGDGPKSLDMHKANVSNAVVAVRTFATLKNIKISPEKEAKLVLLLSEYFDQGGDQDDPLVDRMLESTL